MEQKSEFCTLRVVSFTRHLATGERRSPPKPLFDRKWLFEAPASNTCPSKRTTGATTLASCKFRLSTALRQHRVLGKKRSAPFRTECHVTATSLPDGVYVYELSAVLIHRGVSAYSGHYIAHVKDPQTGEWYKFNDEDIEKMEGKKLQLGIEEDLGKTF